MKDIWRTMMDDGMELFRVERPAWPFSAATRRRTSAQQALELIGAVPAQCERRAGRPPQRAGGPFHPEQFGGGKAHSKGLVVCTMLALLLAALPLFAADTKPAKPDTEAEYTAKLEVRAADVLKALELPDDAKAQRVRGIVIAQYRALRDWHDGYDAKLKGAGDEEARVIRASLKELHGKFVASLAAEMGATQVERVKDRMTYDKVRVTYDGYVEMLPQITAMQRARVLELLKEAREEAMDGGSSDEKTAIFGRYKGRINNYLSTEGYDLKQAGKDWAERRKVKEGKK